MTISDWTAIVALVIASGALALELRRWQESGPRLHLSVMADAIIIPNKDGQPRLALTVRNSGAVPTTLTHMVAYGFESRWHKFRKRCCFAAAIKEPNIPFELRANGLWIGVALYTKETTELRNKGQLYVGVVSAHKDKNFLVRVPRQRDGTVPTKKIG